MVAVGMPTIQIQISPPLRSLNHRWCLCHLAVDGRQLIPALVIGVQGTTFSWGGSSRLLVLPAPAGLASFKTSLVCLDRLETGCRLDAGAVKNTSDESLSMRGPSSLYIYRPPHARPD